MIMVMNIQQNPRTVIGTPLLSVGQGCPKFPNIIDYCYRL